jgi:hypothetical protein
VGGGTGEVVLKDLLCSPGSPMLYIYSYKVKGESTLAPKGEVKYIRSFHSVSSSGEGENHTGRSIGPSSIHSVHSSARDA